MRAALIRLLAIGGLAALAAIPAPATAAPRLAEIGRFTRPVHIASPPNDTRLFVVEQSGVVRVLDADGAIRPDPFLAVGDALEGSERGLLSIAFAPDYATSGLFYAFVTASSPAGQIQVREYRRSAMDPNRADPAPVRNVLAIDHPMVNHNGGGMQFGPDGKLWVSVGDGGGSNDPDANGQDRTELLGKLLRLDPRANGVPPDNPFLAPGDAIRDEIWAYGLRNAWRFSFDRQTGDLVIADVGQDLAEEIDFAAAAQGRLPGANYGWRCYEGTARNSAVPPCEAPGHVGPVHQLRHATDGVCSITGGYVVRDPGLPTLAGRYLYADLCLNRLRSVVLAATGASDDRAEADLAVGQISSFGEDSCGRLLVLDLEGPVFRVVDGDPSACTPGPGPTPGPAPPQGTPARDPCGLIAKLPRSRKRSTVVTRGLRIGVQTFARCRVEARATIAGVGRLGPAATTLIAGERASLRLRGTAAVRGALARRLARRRSVVAKITVTAQAQGFPARTTRGTSRIVR